MAETQVEKKKIPKFSRVMVVNAIVRFEVPIPDGTEPDARGEYAKDQVRKLCATLAKGKKLRGALQHLN